MRIHVDDILDTVTGVKIGEIALHTEVTPSNKVGDPDVPGAFIDVVQFMLKMKTTPAKMVGTGWDQPSKRPDQPGKTLFQVMLSEIVRLNDAPTRAILGV